MQKLAITGKIPRIHDFTSVARREIYFATINFPLFNNEMFADISSAFHASLSTCALNTYILMQNTRATCSEC